MQVVHDPSDARGLVLLALLAVPMALALIAVGIDAAILVAIRTVMRVLFLSAFGAACVGRSSREPRRTHADGSDAG
jgi:hypothetical protein